MDLDWRTKLSSDPLIRYTQLRDDPWLFLKWCVFTQDEVDQENPIKRYPSHLLYLRFLVEMWRKKKKLAIPKSRRLTVSWTFIALALWDCIFHKGRSWAFVSKKELDSAELVERAEFIYNHIPEEILSHDLIPRMKHDRMQTAPPAIEFEEIYSKIMGFPSGGNQLRQRGFSGILEDECAFWDDAEAAYASAEPTTKGGGRLVMVSTRFPGFFKKVCYDKLDSPDLNFSAIPPVPPQKAMEGVDVWTNPRNEFFVIDLSHRANPAKRSPEFEEGLRRTLPIHLYRQEYGKSWDTFAGKPVYEDFNEHIHVTHKRPSFHVGLPLLLGWDSSGLTPACVCAQLQEDRLVVFKEIIGAGMGAVRFVPHVLHEIKLAFPEVHDVRTQTVSFFDPAGFRKNEITEQTYLQVMYEKGFTNAQPGPVTWDKRVDAVTSFLIGLVKGQPKFQIYETDAPVTTAGMKGGFRYSDKVLEAEPDKARPIKDIHCVDAETEILTQNGWKKWNEISANEPIYEYDIENDCMIKGKVEQVFIFEGQMSIWRAFNSKHDLRYTENHRCVIRHKDSGKIKILPFKDIKQGQYFFSPNGVAFEQKKFNFSDDFVELAGWVMAEGHRRESGAYILTQSHKHNQHHVDYLDTLIAKFDGCFRKNDTGKNAQWHIRGNPQFMLNKLMPGKDKTPTAEFIRLMNNNQRRLFIYAAMCGDGDCAHELKGGKRFSRNRDFYDAVPITRIKLQHKAQIDALHMAATLCGMSASVKQDKDKLWSLTISRIQKANPVFESLRKEQLDTNFVWCPRTVTGTWIMRSRGRVYVTGNSHPCEALQYICGGLIDTLGRDYKIEIATPKYSFQKRTEHRKKNTNYGRKMT